ncbi:MAG: DUF3263 domain-containing protein [Mycetocola sp.]
MMSGNPEGSAPSARQALDERDLAILDFENQWWQHAGQKEEAIRSTFSFSPTRYYQLLGVLIDSPAALVHDPLLVKRLQRLRDTRLAARRARARNAD